MYKHFIYQTKIRLKKVERRKIRQKKKACKYRGQRLGRGSGCIGWKGSRSHADITCSEVTIVNNTILQIF